MSGKDAGENEEEEKEVKKEDKNITTRHRCREYLSRRTDRPREECSVQFSVLSSQLFNGWTKLSVNLLSVGWYTDREGCNAFAEKKTSAMHHLSFSLVLPLSFRHRRLLRHHPKILQRCPRA
ncbi:hypothetical protein KQX54_010784 [Cotesia glomerata]|uniref:Uncharacterized protein n=1 Tax=Cotesia glomerata TaxID=32391 RepID=A0AAV7J3T5_COTGL|nr:hypothetical protein KQX54_010784 [Cotesia glomerata]